MMDKTKLTQDEWDALLDEEKMPLPQKQEEMQDEAREPWLFEQMIAISVSKYEGYEAYLAGLVVKKICLHKLNDAKYYLDRLIAEPSK